jgi:glycerate 2-kinase
MTGEDARAHLLALYEAAVDSARPEICLPPHLPAPPASGRLIVLAAGKAAGAMAAAAERHYRDSEAWREGRISGIAVTRHGYAAPLERFTLIEAGHPVPDAGSRRGAQALLDAAAEAQEGDLVLLLLSGGGSALLAAPVDGVSLEDKQAVTRALLRSGAPIDEINTVRRHLSRIKGGRLARAAFPAPCLTLAISDVPGDDPAAIASGPTVPDPSTLADARHVLAHYGITPPTSVSEALQNPANETPKPDDPVFARARYTLIATPAQALERAAEAARARGIAPHLLGSDLEGEAREVAAEHARLALSQPRAMRPLVILSGGELSVTVTGNGRGGPNQEYALALAIALQGAPGIHALAGDTDGADGGLGAADDPAGALVAPDTLERARAAGLDAQAYLTNNDATGFFERLGGLLVTGPTRTNVNDFRAILVENDASLAYPEA